MKKSAFLLPLFAMSLALAGCAASPVIWPDTTAFQWHWYTHKAIGSPEEAIGTLKNMQSDFVGDEQRPITLLDVDAYGLRAAAQWTETSTQAHKVQQQGGAFIGWNYVPYSGTSTQYTTSQQGKVDTLIIPFNEIEGMRILNGLNLPSYKWVLAVGLAGNRQVIVRFQDEYSTRKFADAVATMAEAQGRPLKPRYGFQCNSLTPQQKAAVGLRENDGAALVVAIERGSPADRCGLQVLDVLIRVDGRSYADPDAITEKLSGTTATTVTVLRRVTPHKGKKQVVEEKEIRLSANKSEPAAKDESGGVGISVRLKDDVVTITAAHDGFPAQRAGIHAGDQILKIDDLPTRGLAPQEVASLVAGRPGTRVTLTIMRQGFEAPREFTLTRTLIRGK